MLYILQVLFPYLLLLYLVDCIAYVNDRHLLFCSYFGKHFRLNKSGLHIVGLLPVSQAIVSHNIPIFLTRRGAFIPQCDHQLNISWYSTKKDDFIAYQDIREVEAVGKTMKINARAVVKFPSTASAKQMTETIRELINVEPSARFEKIKEFLSQTTDLQRVRTIGGKNSFLRSLQILSSVLFVNVFGIFPLLLYSELGTYLNTLATVSVSVLLYLIILVLTSLARRGTTGTSISKNVFLSMILSPVTVIHIMKEIVKEKYAHFDYQAIAAVLLPSHLFHRVIREELLQIEHAKGEVEEHDLKEFLKTRENALVRLLAQTGISVSDLLVPPKKQDLSAVSYCPICLSEYRAGIEKCLDCKIYLRKFTALADSTRTESRV